MHSSLQTPGDIPELLTIRELATILKVSQRSIWRLVAAGQLVGPLRVGGSIRWRSEDIRDWINKSCPPLRCVSPEANSTPLTSQEKGTA